MKQIAKDLIAQWADQFQEEQAAPLSKARYSRKETAHLLSMSVRQLDYAREVGDIKVVWEGSRPFFTRQEVLRYARTNHPSRLRKSKKKS